MKKIALHWQILIGMGLGVLAGLTLSSMGMVQFAMDWIKPFGTIFINLLKLIAVPLVLASLISGVSNLSDISKLSRMGSRTLGIYIMTTIIAIVLGLVIANLAQPGNSFSEEKKAKFQAEFAEKAKEKQETAFKVKDQSPLQPLVDIVADNIFDSVSDNRNMLKVIFFAVLFGIAMLMIPPDVAAPVQKFFAGINEIIIKMVELIMASAPFGVFALLASLIVEFAGNDPAEALELFVALGYYSACVLFGLGIMTFAIYPLMLRLFVKFDYIKFFQGISPAQLMAFSTSSSAATLPVTMDRVEKELGVPEQITGFVLPIGATVNMDGTSLYQAVAALFIAQAYGMDLSLSAQLGIIATATLASIGSAAVPGAGLVMLVIVLEQAKIPVDGVTLIFAVDRILDMCRTVVNVTGDATVCTLIAVSEGVLKKNDEEENN